MNQPDDPAKALLAQLNSWPKGYFVAEYGGRRYGVRTSAHAGGRSLKLFAEELGGRDFVSLNLYLPEHGEAALRPCEMPVEKVLAFVAGATPVAA